jgi:hypothetical protein
VEAAQEILSDTSVVFNAFPIGEPCCSRYKSATEYAAFTELGA